MDHPPRLPLLHGGDYNPEQWLHRPDILEEDARLMKGAGVNYVNLGIFAWSSLEPEEGVFDFDWLDACVERLHAHGVNFLLATPTAARPLWLAHKYPEVRLTLENGTLDPFGNRHNFCWSSPVYREKTAAITKLLSERYGTHPGLLGWHISNEYSGSTDAARCYCPLCISRFQDWLRERYDGDLEKLNRHWWTRFWSHNYQDWSQILPGDVTVEGLVLNWRRFSSAQVADFLRHEIASIRTHSAAPVATNLWSDGVHLDEIRVATELDFLGFDSYPDIDGTAADFEAMAGVAWDGARMRGFKPEKPWLLMESCPQQPQWKKVTRAKRPGVHRLLSLQNLANGADGIGYFQWRAGRGSVEKLHGAVLMQDAPHDTRVYREVAALGKELVGLSPLRNSLVRARVALLWDTEQEWAWECNHGMNSLASPQHRARELFALLWKRNIAVDLVSPRADLSAYDLILAPSVFLVPPGFPERLARYVSAGAMVLIDALSGWVDDDLRICEGGRLGPELRELLGVRPEEFDCLRADEVLEIKTYDPALPRKAEGVDFCDRIHVLDAQVIGKVEDTFHFDAPALTVRSYGKGALVYQAVGLSRAAMAHLLDSLCKKRTIEAPIPDIPKGVLVSERRSDKDAFLIILNPHTEATVVPLPDGLSDLRTGNACGVKLELGSWDGVVLRRSL